MKRWILMFFLSTPAVSVAQEVAATGGQPFWSDPFNHPMFLLYVVTALVFVVFLLVMVVSIYIIKILNLFARRAAEEKAVRKGRVYVPEPVWIEVFWQRMNASVPLASEKAIELDHNYDGIRELDNHLPPWWKWLFYGTIAWGVVYLIVFQVTDSLPSSTQEYENQISSAEEAKRKYLASQPVAVIDENTLEYSSDAGILANGKKVFTATNCQTCHRPDGGGNTIGPNLTDPYWLHGGSVKEIFGTIKNGVVEKGMPAWGKAMSPKDVRDVTFYVISLQGTNPPDPKAPQGNLVAPEKLKVKNDTTKTTASLN
jgi:cytochrome c oxidase cbb3-type subunit III